MQIIVEEIVDNEDDTCTVYFNLDQEAMQKLLEVGLLTAITNTLRMQQEDMQRAGEGTTDS